MVLAELGFLFRKVSDGMVTSAAPGTAWAGLPQSSTGVTPAVLGGMSQTTTVLLSKLAEHSAWTKNHTGIWSPKSKGSCSDLWESLLFLLQTNLVKHKVFLELQFLFTDFPLSFGALDHCSDEGSQGYKPWTRLCIIWSAEQSWTLETEQAGEMGKTTCKEGNTISWLESCVPFNEI